jgi:hypothetical protein
MKRKDALVVLRAAGYHNDSKMFARVYVEHRISYTAALKEWNLGTVLKNNGVPCTCYHCTHP